MLFRSDDDPMMPTDHINKSHGTFEHVEMKEEPTNHPVKELVPIDRINSQKSTTLARSKNHQKRHDHQHCCRYNERTERALSHCIDQ